MAWHPCVSGSAPDCADMVSIALEQDLVCELYFKKNIFRDSYL